MFIVGHIRFLVTAIIHLYFGGVIYKISKWSQSPFGL